MVAPRTLAGDEPEQLKCAHVTANFFDVLGIRAAAGRTFSPTDTGSAAVMLTSGIFGRRFLGDRGILGKGLSTREGAKPAAATATAAPAAMAIPTAATSPSLASATVAETPLMVPPAQVPDAMMRALDKYDALMRSRRGGAQVDRNL